MLLSVILVLGAVVRLMSIGTESLWLDEAQSVWAATQKWDDIPGFVRDFDQHPPAYYLALHFWMALGKQEGVLRLLSALFSVFTIPVIFGIGRRLHGSTMGILMALLFAVWPAHVQYAQEVRMYALLTFLLAVALWALIILITREAGERTDRIGESNLSLNSGWMSRPLLPWIVYVCFAAAALYTHSTAMFFLGAAHVAVAWAWFDRTVRPPFLRRWFVAHGAIGLFYVPWIPSLLQQGNAVSDLFWIPAISPEYVYRTLGQIWSPSLEYASPGVRYTVQALLLLLAIIGMYALRRDEKTRPILLGMWLIPVVLSILVSLWKPVFLARTLLWTAIPFSAVLVAGVLSFRPLWMRSIVASALIAGAMAGALLHLGSYEKENWRAAAAAVCRGAAPGELVLFLTPTGRLVFDYYAPPERFVLRRAGVPAELYERGWEPRMTPDDVAPLRHRLRNEKRVWLVLSHAWFNDPEGLVLRTGRSEGIVTPVGVYNGVDVYTIRPHGVESRFDSTRVR